MAKKKDKSDKKEESIQPVVSDKKKKKADKKASSGKSTDTVVRPKKAPVSPEVGILEQALIQISNDAITLRAYFLGEQRQRDGHHNDSHHNWVEAERQLHAEAKKPGKKK
ncbi:MAG: hypothetical protein ABI615_08555 [Chthoniobacterales bacterium]